MQLTALFSGHRTIRGVIESVLEGRLGAAVPDGGRTPAVARLDIGCYAIFGGDPSHPAAERLVADVAVPNELVGPDDQAWRDRFVAVHGSRLTDRPMRTFAVHALDPTSLRAQASGVPDGFAVVPIDADLAGQLGGDIVPHAMQVFPDTATFVADGVGFGVVRGDRLVSAATSYTISSRHVEVAIATHADFRGRGLARVAAARLIAHCLAHGLIPDWSASNPVSKRLALSLGYRPGPVCDIFYLE